MNQEELEKIRAIAARDPKAYRLTLVCLGQRDEMIEEIERDGQCHDSLVATRHFHFAQALENCDMMLMNVFGTERKEYEAVFNFKSVPAAGRDQHRERLSLEYQVQSAV